MSDWTKPTTASNYSTEFIQQLDARLKDLAYGLDPTYVTSYTGIPTNSFRVNWSGAAITLQSYNGTSWSTIAKNINMTAVAASTLATARNLVLTGDIAGSVSFNGSSNVTTTATLTSVNAVTTTVGSSTTVPVLGFNTKGQVTSVGSVSIANSITSGGAITNAAITLQTGTGVTSLARFQSNAAGTILYLGNGTVVNSFSHDTLTSTLQNKTMGSGSIWNGGTISVSYGGTGATSLTGILKGTGTTAFTVATGTDITTLIGTNAVTNAGYATTAGACSGNSVTSTKAGSLGSGGVGGSAMTFLWSDPGGQPTYYWGGTDGANMRVYATSALSVNYANSAATTSQTSWTNLTTTTKHTVYGSQDVASISTTTANMGGIEILGAGGAKPAFVSFHRPGQFAAYFGLDYDNQWKVGGWSYGAVAYTLIHSGNLGTGLSWNGSSLNCTVTAPVQSVGGQIGAVTNAQLRASVVADLGYTPANGASYVAKDLGSSAVGATFMGYSLVGKTVGGTYSMATFVPDSASSMSWSSGTARVLQVSSGDTNSYCCYLCQRIA